MTSTARIALLQLRAFGIEDAAASLRHTLAKIDEAAAARPDIIVLPEVTYPAYFLGGDDLSGAGVLAPGEVLETFGARARAHGAYIAAGLALEREFGDGPRYANAAVLFGRDGSVVGRYDKSFLWQFDSRWFRAGNAYPVFETDVARVGMLICADGRLPEIARSLVVNGAQIILDLTAWVSGGRTAAQLTSIQRQFLMPARAIENGAWIVAADKVGIEAESIVYCGGSCVIDPGGAYVAQLGPDEQGVLVYDVPVQDAGPPVARRPQLYETLAHPTASLPVVRGLEDALVPAHEQRVAAAVQMRPPPDPAAFVEAVRRHCARLALQDVALAVFPAPPADARAAYQTPALVDALSDVARETGVFIAFAAYEGDGARWMHLVGPRGPVAAHRQTHALRGNGAQALGEAPAPVVATPLGRVGLMCGAEGFVPEVARSLMLRGAEMLAWCADGEGPAMTPIARARAEENRVTLLCASPPTPQGATMAIDPSGAVLADALEGRELAVTAVVNRAWSHVKSRVPGTDVVRDRQPETYRALVEGA
jgi:predicted amidohydrolase